jgi:pilus assembly protein TadC
MTLPFAFMAAFGVFLFYDAIRPRPLRVRLTESDRRPLTQRLIDSLFAPAAERVMSIGRTNLADHKATLAVKLARAGYPSSFTTPEAVMGYRLFTAILFAVFGGIFALIIGLGSAALFIMAGLGFFGWGMPDRVIANAERERKEQLTLDAASTMDRLAIFVASGNALPAAIRSLAERPGGAWVGEFRKVAASYAISGDFQASMDDVDKRGGHLPEIAKVFDRLKAAYEMGGGGTGKSLRQMANDARIAIRMLITERGYKNAIYMVIPAFFAIVAIAVILIAPGAVRMVGVLGG